MIRKFYIGLLAFLPAIAMAQSPSIQGKIAPLKNANALIYLQYGSGTSAISDSTKVVNGSFQFDHIAVNNASKAMLIISPNGVPLNKFSKQTMNNKKALPPDYIDLFIDHNNDKITVLSADSLKNAKITGSQLNVEYKSYQEGLKTEILQLAELNSRVRNLTANQREDKEVIAPMEEARKSLVEQLAQKNLTYAQQNPDKYFALIAMMEYLRANPNDATPISPVFNKLASSVKNQPLAKLLNQSIQGAMRTAVGSVIPPFEMNNPNGKSIQIADFKGNYTLIYFWASWCETCRDNNQDLQAMYREYRSRGFNILGVSLDKERSAWVKAINEDQLEFPQVSDLKGWENSVAEQLGVRRIPDNILIDPQGKIVAKNLTNTELTEKMRDLLN